MARPRRLQFADALYHVTSRGDRKSQIYRNDGDRLTWLNILDAVCAQYEFTVYAYCLMGNHYHLLVRTAQANLDQGMRQLNGVYSQYFNRHHELVGHLFQGRYHAVVVDADSYLLELARYVVLNPVRAGLAARPGDWFWSSYNHTQGVSAAPSWLDVEWLLSAFDIDPEAARSKYANFVVAGVGLASPLQQVHRQLILGPDSYIEKLRQPTSLRHSEGISKLHQGALALPLQDYQEKFPNRDEAIAHAYLSRAYAIMEIARHFRVSRATVDRALKKHRAKPSSS
ncbi:transposase [Duganella callida]|uniref:Transposase n=1 Tax=Duganella callida TaxID=2561932 RepID=A0A4Y9S5M2_9BURK|nr:transposase [Duganella callida]TFW14788.1 transposase [Duganella callida]